MNPEPELVMGPLDVFLGWQALLTAVIAAMLMQLVKALIDLGHAPAGGTGTKIADGREVRRQSRILTRVILPALPPLIGAALALVLPLPESLAEYVASADPWWLALAARAAWGAACGQFSDYLYSKVKSLLRHEAAA